MRAPVKKINSLIKQADSMLADFEAALKEPVEYLLSNALRLLSVDQIAVLRDQLSDRLPKKEITPIREYVIDILPATHVRMIRRENWMLSEKITYEYLRGLDDARFEEKGKRGTLEARKKQLEINHAHKLEIRGWVLRNGFKMPLGHCAVWFYVPMPPSWRKKKREEMLYTVHQSTPDLDNYLKQLYDSIMPRKNRQMQEKGTDDRKIFCYAAFKVWVPLEEACMKVLEYDPAEFNEVFKHGHPAYRKVSIIPSRTQV